MEYLSPLINSFKEAANPDKAIGMKSYMKNLFEFYGIDSKSRKEIQKHFFKANGWPGEDNLFQVVNELWNLPQREFQYCAIDILQKFSKKLQETDILNIEKLITEKSWWDSVDGLSAWICGAYFQKFPEKIPTEIGKWIDSNNIWLQRSTLLFQLKYKQQTNTGLLNEIVVKLASSDEFFIRKAVGWILREYSKTNPEWVKNLVSEQPLSPLSYKEATKYI